MAAEVSPSPSSGVPPQERRGISSGVGVRTLARSSSNKDAGMKSKKEVLYESRKWEPKMLHARGELKWSSNVDSVADAVPDVLHLKSCDESDAASWLPKLWSPHTEEWLSKLPFPPGRPE